MRMATWFIFPPEITFTSGGEKDKTQYKNTMVSLAPCKKETLHHPFLLAVSVSISLHERKKFHKLPPNWI